MKRTVFCALLLLPLFSAFADVTLPGAVRKVHVNMSTTVPSASVDGRSWENLPQGSTTIGNIRFTIGTDGSVRLTPLTEDIEVSCSGFVGVAMDLAQNVTATLRVDSSAQTVNVSAPTENLRPVTLRFAEGGHIQMSAGSQGRTEFFANKSYIVRASGPVQGINGEGQKINLSEPGAFMTGGPLTLVKDKSGTETWRRSSPTVQVTVSGTLGSNAKVMADGQEIELSGNGKQTLRIPEVGAVFMFEELESQSALLVRVEKGEMNLSVEGIGNWNAFLSRGQSAKITWNRLARTVDLKNLSSSSVFVNLPARNLVDVSPAAFFQYTVLPGRKYATAASGGIVQMYSADRNVAVNLASGNQVFNASRGEGPSRKPGLPIYLNWDTGAPLGLNASVDYAQLPPGTEHVVKFASQGEANIYYSDGGFLEVEAVEHKFTLVIAALNGLLVELEGGDSVTMILDKRKGTFTLKTGIDNSFAVNVDTQNGFAPAVGANKAINFNIKKDGSALAHADGFLLNFDPPDLDPLAINENMNPVIDRIDQEPVSVVR